MILVDMVTILAGYYELFIYQNTCLHNMVQRALMITTTLFMYMLFEMAGHQHSSDSCIMLISCLWPELLGNMCGEDNILSLKMWEMITYL